MGGSRHRTRVPHFVMGVRLYSSPRGKAEEFYQDFDERFDIKCGSAGSITTE
jgi:hypothetical protein